ncbi:MAG: hypothetical protein ABFS45_06615 [Pseudomonadota bacterium]
MTDVIWVSWQGHRRTSGICDYLAVDLHVVKSTKKSVTRYPQLIYRTIRLLRTEKPKVLFIQNPSIVLTALSILLRPFFGYRLVVDAHNEAVQPYVHDNLAVRIVSTFLLRNADLTIVTNLYLAETVTANRGEAFVLPDRLPEIDGLNPVDLVQGAFNIIVIATYAADEPILSIIDAAAMLQGRVTLYVTGDYSRLDESIRRHLPANIVFTGFLSDEDYWGYLKSADAIIDLTTMDNCLVCGAYEGVAVAKPLVLSRNDATVRYFSKGVVYTDNSAQDIHRALLELIGSHDSLSGEMAELADELPGEWKKNAESLRRRIEKWC